MFIDEARIRVQAGSGGRGCVSFRREKHTPRGGPDGGNGGRGGSVYVTGDADINTLIALQYERLHKAPNGAPGGGRNSTGRGGDDVSIGVPPGTRIFDADTDELIGELTKAQQTILVAKGGEHGLGNTCFKSSTNRSPRKSTPGQPGESRTLRLELSLLADVGLVGLPNAGKSSLIAMLTNARPRTAPFPFTTLAPSLGVVTLEQGNRFTIADIPGLIEGASTGSGLGIRFLKHLRHTRLLFHMVDISGGEDCDELAKSIDTIDKELRQFDDELGSRTRWLVLNKTDLLAEEQIELIAQQIVERSGWEQKVFTVSAVTGHGCEKLTNCALNWLQDDSSVQANLTDQAIDV